MGLRILNLYSNYPFLGNPLAPTRFSPVVHRQLISQGRRGDRLWDPVAMATPAGVPERNDRAKGLAVLFPLFCNSESKKGH